MCKRRLCKRRARIDAAECWRHVVARVITVRQLQRAFNVSATVLQRLPRRLLDRTSQVWGDGVGARGVQGGGLHALAARPLLGRRPRRTT